MRVEYDPRSIDYLAEMAKEGRLKVSDPGWIDPHIVRFALLRFPLPSIYIDSSEDPWRIVWGDHISHLVRFVIGFRILRVDQITKLLIGADPIPSAFELLPLNMQRRLRETEIKIYRLYPPEKNENKDDIQMQFRAMVSALHPR